MMKTRYFLTISMILLAIMFIGSGCGGGGGDSSTPPISNTPTDDGDDIGDVVIDDPSTPASDEEKVTKLIKADSGGTVSLKNGISLYIPPYALDQDTEISLSSVDITQFDGDVATQGGVNGLHIIGAIFEPERTMMNIPAKILFPLPAEWDPSHIPVLYETQGNNPAEALPSGSNVVLKKIDGSYFAEIETYHFCVKIISHNCHAGTIKRVINSFENRGCSRKEIFDKIAEEFPGTGITIDIKNAKHSNEESIQAFLDTFFIGVGSYNQGNDIGDYTMASVTQEITSGRQVVLAFSKETNFPMRGGINNFFSFNNYDHTATLTRDTNGTIQMYHTIVRSTSSRWNSELLKTLGGVYDYTYPWEKINDYRTLKQGVAFELQVCGEPGCLSDPSKNKYSMDVWPSLDGPPWWNSSATSPLPRKNGYPSVYIYVERGGVLDCMSNCDVAGRWNRVYSDYDCDGYGDRLVDGAYVDFLDDGRWKEHYTTFEREGNWIRDAYYDDWINMKFDSIDYADKKGGIWSTCNKMQIENRMFTPDKTYRDLGYSSSCQVYER